MRTYRGGGLQASSHPAQPGGATQRAPNKAWHNRCLRSVGNTNICVLATQRSVLGTQICVFGTLKSVLAAQTSNNCVGNAYIYIYIIYVLATVGVTDICFGITDNLCWQQISVIIVMAMCCQHRYLCWQQITWLSDNCVAITDMFLATQI